MPISSNETQRPRIQGSRFNFTWKTPVIAVGAFFLLCTAWQSFYLVQQNEFGAVTRLGKLISTEPVGPGLSWKTPWIDTSHTVQTSINKLFIPDVRVKTVDNQFVSVDVSLTYQTGDVFKTLFQVGEMGNGGVHDKVIPFVQSRTLDVFGQVSALEIADKKKSLEDSILIAVAPQVMELFGQTIKDVQITKFNYDKNFEDNIQITVQTRNQQLAAQNMLKVRETEALQNVAIAKGKADSSAAEADGQKRAAIAQAEASATSVKLAADAAAYDTVARADADSKAKREVGSAESEVIATKAKAAGSADAYANIIRAESLFEQAKHYQGGVPQYNVALGGGNGGAQPVVVLPNLGK